MLRSLVSVAVCAVILCGGLWLGFAQQSGASRYRVDVNLVALTFSVTDPNGHPVHGLKPEDLLISEDGIPQKIAAFAEGNTIAGQAVQGASTGTNVFILFDTSDRMYRNIPYVCDAIADFLRKLDPADAAAIYTFSRNLSRAAPLTKDRSLLRAALAQNISVGDDTALIDSILLTVRDAAAVQGRKAVVVFSNGPDNRSMLSPEDVGTVAVNEGIPIYVITTLDPAKEHLMADALERLTTRTGGKLYIAPKWQAQAQAFVAIQQEVGAAYTAYYYPAPNPNDGFRHIKVEIVSAAGRTYKLRTRGGYQPHVPGRPATN